MTQKPPSRPWCRRHPWLTRIGCALMVILVPFIESAFILWEQRESITDAVLGFFGVAFLPWDEDDTDEYP